MKTLYESILDNDHKIVDDTVERAESIIINVTYDSKINAFDVVSNIDTTKEGKKYIKLVGETDLSRFRWTHRLLIENCVCEGLNLRDFHVNDGSLRLVIRNCKIGNLKEVEEYIKSNNHLSLDIDSATIKRSKVQTKLYDVYCRELSIGDIVINPFKQQRGYGCEISTIKSMTPKSVRLERGTVYDYSVLLIDEKTKKYIEDHKDEDLSVEDMVAFARTNYFGKDPTIDIGFIKQSTNKFYILEGHDRKGLWVERYKKENVFPLPPDYVYDPKRYRGSL